MTANPIRGEVALTLDGVEHVMRPTWEAIQAFEAKTGKGLMQLARQAIDGELRSSEIASIAAECIRAWGRATGNESAAQVNDRRVGELIAYGEGMAEGMKQIGAVLLHAATGGYTASGEVKPAETIAA